MDEVGKQSNVRCVPTIHPLPSDTLLRTIVISDPAMGATIHPLSHGTVWASAAELIERAPSLDDLRAHRIQFLAAHLWQDQGRAVPTEVLDEARAAATTTVAAPILLKRARAAYDGKLMLMKGPEVAARYPTPGCRYFHDVDLLADNPAAAQKALVSADMQRQGAAMNAGLPSTVTVPESVAWQQFADEMVLVDVNAGEYHVAGRMWQALQDCESVDAAYVLLRATYDVDAETLRDDLAAFIGDLIEKGLLETP